MNRLAQQIAGVLGAFDAPTAAGLLTALNERVAQQFEDKQRAAQHATEPPPQPTDPSDVGAPPGAPRPTPVTAELVAAAQTGPNEAEILEDIREVRSGRGRTLDQFIGELEALTRPTGDSPATKG